MHINCKKEIKNPKRVEYKNNFKHYQSNFHISKDKWDIIN
jgi:hypothetical protein